MISAIVFDDSITLMHQRKSVCRLRMGHENEPRDSCANGAHRSFKTHVAHGVAKTTVPQFCKWRASTSARVRHSTFFIMILLISEMGSTFKMEPTFLRMVCAWFAHG